jgi:Leucine-rich repeat (LRR) protein
MEDYSMEQILHKMEDYSMEQILYKMEKYSMEQLRQKLIHYELPHDVSIMTSLNIMKKSYEIVIRNRMLNYVIEFAHFDIRTTLLDKMVETYKIMIHDASSLHDMKEIYENIMQQTRRPANEYGEIMNGTMIDVASYEYIYQRKIKCVQQDKIYHKSFEFDEINDFFKFDCNGKRLIMLPSTIGLLTDLLEFNCYDNNLTTLPSEFGLLINLQKLNFNNNLISCFPSEIQQLINLRELDCSNNLLKIIPSFINVLTNLQKLNCSHNKLIDLPLGIEQLINLQEFDCSYNKLKSFPPEFNRLINLQYLNCCHNELTSLEIQLNKLTKIRKLFCSHNRLLNLPSKLGTGLIELHCKNNFLTVLPQKFELLINLRILDCSQNHITILPQHLNNLINLCCRRNKLSSLQTLIIDENSFEWMDLLPKFYLPLDIRKNIGEFVWDSCLQELDCRHNMITQIPTKIYDKLKTLRCDKICNKNYVINALEKI